MRAAGTTSFTVHAAGVLMTALLVLLCMPAAGQDMRSYFNDDPEEVKADPILQGIGRWSFKINGADLLLTVPNAGVEIDLGKDKYSQSSLSLTARCNWSGNHSYKPYNVLDILEFRPEYRRYHRSLDRKNKVLYWGIYGSAGTYSFKFSRKGHQGMLYGLGGSIGFVTPLYEYRKFAMDLEVGCSAGLALRTDDPYVRSQDMMEYLSLPDESTGLSIVPFPVMSELRVAFVFRKVPASQRYHLTPDQRTVMRQKKALRDEKRETKKEGKK